MKYRKLGDSDLEVSEISLGSWLTFGVGVEADKASVSAPSCARTHRFIATACSWLGRLVSGNSLSTIANRQPRHWLG